MWKLLGKGLIVAVATLLLILGFALIAYAIIFQGFFGIKELVKEINVAGLFIIIGIFILAGIYFIYIAIGLFKRI